MRFKKRIEWTPGRMRQLRERRTQTEFAMLLGVAKSALRRWESGRVNPAPTCSARLSALAERENFDERWQSVGSMRLVGDIESARAEIADLFRVALERSARDLDR